MDECFYIDQSQIEIKGIENYCCNFELFLNPVWQVQISLNLKFLCYLRKGLWMGEMNNVDLQDISNSQKYFIFQYP